MTKYDADWVAAEQKKRAWMAKNGLYSEAEEHASCGVGLVVSIDGMPSRKVVEHGIAALKAIWHRGAVDADGKTGDGAGLLIDIPHDYFTRICSFSIPEQRAYAVGMVFLPKISNQYNYCKTTFENEINKQGLAIIGWRAVPVDSSQLGDIARASEPNIEQLFIGKTADIDEATFKAKLYALLTESEFKNLLYNLI